MKIAKALPIMFLLVPGVGQAVGRELVSEEDRTVVQVFDAPGFSKEQVFEASRMWIAENFRSAESVIEYEDREGGIIIGKGSIAYPCDGGWTCRIRAGSWRVSFTMSAEAKAGRFRLTFTNVQLSYPPYNNMGVSRAAYEEPVSSKEDMDNVRAKLLEFGPQIVARLGAAQDSSDW